MTDRAGRLRGKVALVTGGAQGIGRACAELFAEEGATVVVGDVREPERFADGAIGAQQLDVTREEDWARVVGAIVDEHGGLDVLVNSAGGVGSYEPLDTIALEDWRRIVALNQDGSFYAVRHVVPVMRRGGGGSIVLLSSIWGIAGAPGVSAYTASKGAVRLMAKNAALSYVGDGIRVNSLHPGIVDTPMIAAQAAEITDAVVGATPMGRLGTPKELAYGALFLASDESSFMTGCELVIDGGYVAR